MRDAADAARRLKAFKTSHVRAAGGARAQARRSTGDVLGRLPSGRSSAKAKDGSGSHSALLSRMDGIG